MTEGRYGMRYQWQRVNSIYDFTYMGQIMVTACVVVM